MPNDTDLHLDLAADLLESGRGGAALTLLSASDPDISSQPHRHRHLLGKALMALERWEGATDHLRIALRQAPTDLDVAADLTWAFEQAGLLDQAEHLAKTLKALLPDPIGPNRILARILRRQNRPGDALHCLLEAHEKATQAGIAPPGLSRDLAQCHQALQNWSAAIPVYRRAIEESPADATAWTGLGACLDQLQTADAEAEEALRHAITLDPDDPDWRYNLAAFLIARDRLEEALPLLEQACKTAPERAHLWTNLGICRLGLGDGPGAVAAHRQAIDLEPAVSEAWYAYSWALLADGDYRQGWAAHEHRLTMPQSHGALLDDPNQLWDGTALPTGGRLVLHAEQGLGDSIMVCRLLAKAKAQATANTLVLIAPSTLHPVLGTIPAIDHMVASTDPGVSTLLEADDRHLPLLSLPHLLKLQPKDLPGPVPYLCGSSSKEPRPEGSPLRIGLVWAGAADNPMDHLRTCPLEDLIAQTEKCATLRAKAGQSIEWVSLQWPVSATTTGLPAHWRNPMSDVHDLSDTAEILSGLDGVLGVDTAVTHLAGAMGLPVFLLLAFSPDYRWGLHGQKTIWYPGHWLCRQPCRGAWQEALAAATEALTAYAEGNMDFFTQGEYGYR
ncbi:MAG: tetratricopeptide repeat protein [Rhodospirillaceae bacterium]